MIQLTENLMFLVVQGAVAVLVSAAIEADRAIERSRDLTRGHFWHVLGTIVFAWTIMIVLALGAGIMLASVFELVGMPDVISDGLGALLFVALFPFVGVAATVLYYDLRVRNEGADLIAMMEALPQVPAAAARDGQVGTGASTTV